MKADERIAELQNKLLEIREEIKRQISSLPDNPKIKRLGERCFTISSKDLGDVWSPEYHDFKHQYETIIGQLDKMGTAAGVNFLRRALKKGSFWIGYTYKLNPQVIEHLKSIL